MLTIVNYGVGNVMAFHNVFRRLKVPFKVATCKNDLVGASKLVLPGVGAFDWAMRSLNASGMRDTLDDLVVNQKVDVLGVCVGFQMMAKKSEEGTEPGLGWLKGNVLKLDHQFGSSIIRLPHMGWNDIKLKCSHPLFDGLKNSQYYFLHSYEFQLESPTKTVATSLYGKEFVSAACFENVFGVQFHPEKSHDWGEMLLKNFAKGASC